MKKEMTGVGCKSGFTVIEMVLVGSVIAVITAMAVANVRGRSPTHELEKASWQVMSDLRSARMEAVSKSTHAVVTFDDTAKSYTIWVDANKNSAVDSGEETTKSLGNFTGLSLYTTPDTGTFEPRGTFTSTAYYWYIRMGTSAGYRYVYVFPSGQVDPYGS